MTNVISADHFRDKHYLHSGFSSTITSSYASPDENPTGLTWDSENVISAELAADKHYLHDGFSATITDSYAAPAADPSGITWDGTNVLSADPASSGKHYLHDGFSATITSSYAVPESPFAGARDLTWDGTNVISVDSATDKHFLHDGFSATVTSSYTSPDSLTPRGITWDGNNVLSNGQALDKTFLHDGFSATVTSSFSTGAYSSPQPDGLTWDGRAFDTGPTEVNVSGSQPAATGTVTAKFTSKTLEGNQPASTGALLGIGEEGEQEVAATISWFVVSEASTYSNALAGAENVEVDQSPANYLSVGQFRYLDSIAKPYFLYQTFLDFDTSGVPSSAQITATTLSVYGVTGRKDETWRIEVYTFNHGGSGDTGDWRTPAEIAALGDILGSIDSADWDEDGYNVITLDADAIVREGTTRLIMVLRDNRLQVPPGGQNLANLGNFEYHTVTDKEPKLTITYLSTNVSPAGNQAAPSGALTVTFFDTPAGEQAAPSGAITALTNIPVAGNQPNDTGRLLVSQLKNAGEQPGPSGALTVAWVNKLVEGNQPNATGVAPQYVVTLTGNQPAATGDVQAAPLILQQASGSQDAPSGTLTALFVALHLYGDQDAPTGRLSTAIPERPGRKPQPGTGRFSDVPRPGSGSYNSPKPGVGHFRSPRPGS